MNKKLILAIALVASFSCGFVAKSITTPPASKPQTTKRVTGIGGIFFKCNDPGSLRSWYHTHLGLNTDQFGATFEWRLISDSTKIGTTQWSLFADKTKYFAPSSKDFMINYRVENMDWLVDELKKEGVTLLDEVKTFSYGKFVHIMDPEGNKVELWEPME